MKRNSMPFSPAAGRNLLEGRTNRSRNATRRWRKRLRITATLIIGLQTAGESHADVDASSSAAPRVDLRSMSLDELSNITVTSVSKKEENLASIPAAVSVVTQDDIRRSGATTLPQVLRSVPGVNVGQVDSHQWAVSIRGFNDTFANKLLVLMDGRSIYTPLFSGVLWQAQDVLLEDVDRIEVIRGPGATLWGANAVNGVINIVSKSARDTQGLLLAAGGGSSQLALAGVRYGGPIGSNAFYRVYGKYSQWDDFPLVGGGDANDRWYRSRGGFRIDWEQSSVNRFTLQGDAAGLTAHQTTPRLTLVPLSFSTRAGTWDQQDANLLGRWQQTVSDSSDFTLQTFYDASRFESRMAGENRHTVDFDARHRLQISSRQELVWGGGYRLTASDLDDSVELSIRDHTRSDQIFNAFFQDEVTLVQDRLNLTVGTKLEHNDFTGFEIEPAGRISWTPHSRHTIWASVARAVRTPSQLEADSEINIGATPAIPPVLPAPSLITIRGDSSFSAESLIAYELGYRLQPHRKVSVDLAGFINAYDQLRGTRESLDTGHLPDYLHVHSTFNNAVDGQTYGGELAITWQALDWWRLYGTCSYLDYHLHSNLDLAGRRAQVQRGTAQNQAGIRSSMNLHRDVDLDVSGRYVDTVEAAGVPNLSTGIYDQPIPSYVELDLRVAWRPRPGLEVSISGQNLLDREHREFNPSFLSSQFTEVPRSIFAKLTWEF